MTNCQQDLAYSLCFSIMARLTHYGFDHKVENENTSMVMEMLWELHEILADC